MIMKRTGPTNLRTRDLVVKLDKHGKTSKQDIYRLLSDIMSMSTRERAEVSLAHLEKMSEQYKGKVLVVPGKVLSKGELTKAFEVAAFAYSETAKKKIHAAKGKAMTFEELIHEKIPTSKMILVK